MSRITKTGGFLSEKLLELELLREENLTMLIREC